MNKRGLITFIFVFLVTVLSFYFMIFVSKNLGAESILSLLLISVIPITIFMYQELKNIKGTKLKFIYDVLLMIFSIVSLLLVIYVVYTFISCNLDENCSYDIISIGVALYIPTMITIFLISISNIFRKTNKLNDYLTIITSIIILFTYLRYYLDSNLLNNIYPKSNFEYYNFVLQNYIYYVVMYMTIIIHKFINKVS